MLLSRCSFCSPLLIISHFASKSAHILHLSRKSMLCSSPTGHAWRMIAIRLQELPLVQCRHASWRRISHSLSITRSSADDVASVSSPLQLSVLTEYQQDESLQRSASAKKRSIKPEIEIQRRRKIGMANKGKIPWNKGRQHSPETREKIRRRTIAALRDPKVRKKMAESPRSHSDQSKAKIGLALKEIWAKRLGRKVLKERCYWAWAGSIADAAREGGPGQCQLEWDSYERMNSDILSHHLRWKAERERQKEIERRRAERALKSKSTKVKAADPSQGAQNVKQKKSGERKRTVYVPKNAKLRAKFNKINLKQQSEEPRSDLPAVERWDLEFIKREKMRQSISFAEQILAIKKQRVVQRS